MALKSAHDTQRIHADPAILVGKPVVRGTRISVELILDWFSESFDLDEFFEAYPDITVEDVQAALAFAKDAVRDDYLRSPERKEALAAAKKMAEMATATA
ncbi:MAG: DUF433 domain-containing protein [Chloroflexota bacterium]|nr:DUF433 domain-containing protein [Chloroflexia bacterium]MDQ3225848.1 DUF433 domain-containing protein [Chloroflexota bacterium]